MQSREFRVIKKKGVTSVSHTHARACVHTHKRVNPT